MTDQLFPRWARELERYMPMKSLFYLYKNINDIYLFPQKSTTCYHPDFREKSDLINNFVTAHADRYSFDPAASTITVKGFMLRGELDDLEKLFSTNDEIKNHIRNFFTESKDYNNISNPESIQWLNYNLNQYLYFYIIMNGYYVVAYYDLVDGFTFPFNNKFMKETFMKLVRAKEDVSDLEKVERQQLKPDEARSRINQVQLKVKIDDGLDMIRRALTNKEIPVAVIFKYSSRILSTPTNLSLEENKSFIRLLKINEESALTFVDDVQRRNIMLLITDRLNDLPPWLYLNNPQAKPLQIDLPDNLERKRYFRIMRNFFHDSETVSDLEKTNLESVFTDLTTGMTNIDLENIRSISNSEKVSLKNIKNIVQRYKFGIVESDWDKIEKSKLNKAEEILRKRVKGQEEAILHTLDVIKRAKIGLSGIQSGKSGNRPRGVLFFAGPTGVGKTELAKSLAEFLFGDEKKCIRFDMSEYAQEHSDQKLLGAPPGYIGYEEGGQLTNSIKENPFSILLFDEIEKAHPKIFDKFLQIIDDGRMTDGKGETVYFTESIIVFTSNLGTYIQDEEGRITPNTDPTMPYEEVKEKIMDAIRNYFNYTLKRPELLNRFGENFIVFDYIREKVGADIIAKILKDFSVYMKEEKGIEVEFETPVISFIKEKSFNNLEFGGRGIGNVVEKYIVNPFSRYIFDNDVQKGASLKIQQVEESTNITHLRIV